MSGWRPRRYCRPYFGACSFSTARRTSCSARRSPPARCVCPEHRGCQVRDARQMLRRLISSASFLGAATFALGGAGFALANVLLAAALSPAQFGLLSLIMALMWIGWACGPLGLDVVIKRHRPR